MRTPTMEDYLETIFNLIKEKGYARVADIAERLDVHPSSVTKMVQRLDKDEYLVYEKYRGFMLTNKGKKLGKRLVDRHELLESFLQLLNLPEDVVARDVEGMEHHVSPETLDALSDLLQFFAEDPSRLRIFHDLRMASAEASQEEPDRVQAVEAKNAQYSVRTRLDIDLTET
ncbi:MAG: transcriptional regulator MntR [Candidatus Carbobacillus altaicus]|nr:transcriptional regulator MntR [Candidatus Carbobacillus altaicus]